MSNVFGGVDYGTTANVLGVQAGNDKVSKGGDRDGTAVVAGTNDAQAFQLVANGQIVESLNADRTASFYGAGGSVQLDASDLSGNSTLRWSTLLRTRSVLDYGAKGDGVTNDSTTLSAAFNTSNSIVTVPAGTYLLQNMVIISASNVIIRGVGRASRLRRLNAANLIRLATTNDIVFEDLMFECTRVQATEDFYGIIWSQDSSVRRITFNRCYFTVPNCNTNALKFINEGAQTTDGIVVRDCVFENIGRMGIELQNNTPDPATFRYRNILIDNCRFINTGLSGSYGMGVSFTGGGERVTVRNCTFTNTTMAIENVGSSDSVFDSNRFEWIAGNPHTLYTCFSFSGAITMQRCRVTNNICENACLDSIRFYNQQYLYSAGNVFITAGSNSNVLNYVYYRDVNDARITNDTFITQGLYSVLMEGTASNNCSRNTFTGCIFDNSAANVLSPAITLSIFRTSGTGGGQCTDNRLFGCHFVRGATGGVHNSFIGSATRAETYNCTSTVGNKVFGDSAVGGAPGDSAGTLVSYSGQRFASSGGNSVTFNISNQNNPLGILAQPIVARFVCASNMWSGGTMTPNTQGYGEALITYTLSSTIANIAWFTNSIANMTITVSSSGTQLQITVTNTASGVGTSSNGGNLMFSAFIHMSGPVQAPLRLQ